MATGPGVDQGKTAFLEEFLPDNRDADLDAAKRAWNAAGHEGTISESLFGKIRSKLKLTSKRGANGRVSEDDARPASKGKAKAKGKKDNGASKVEEPVPQAEARSGDTGPSKSSFVEEVLGREPQANLKTVNGAWSSASHEGSISPSIFYKVKRELGVTGEQTPVRSEAEASDSGPVTHGIEEAFQVPAARQTATATTSVGQPGASGDLGRVVDEVEAGIDELMFTLKVNGGMPEVEAALRAARRLLTRSNVV